MFFESLESRQMLAVVHESDLGTVWETYAGNYVPAQEFHSAAPNYLSGPTSGDGLAIGIDYFKQHAADFGLAPSDLDHYTVSNDYTDDHNGVRHIYLQQTFHGLPVSDAVGSIHISAAGQVLSAGINFLPGLLHPPPNFPWMVTADIPASTALASLAGQTGRGLVLNNVVSETFAAPNQATLFSGSGIAGLSADPIPASLHYVPKPGGGMDLAWKFVVRNPEGTHWYEASIGANNGGRPNQVIRLGDYTSHASYNVFAQPVDDPLDGFRTVAIDPQDSEASPFGWHDINGFVGPEFFDLRGNNVSAQEDLNGDLSGGFSPNSPILEFNDNLVLPAPAGTYTDAATTNAFYWANLTHDITFHYGFTERAGNFQQENYTNRGRSDDAVRLFTQTPVALNNAFMATPPDGQPPILAIGLATTFVPFRDIALDSPTIIHEYTHGISNRLTGGAANANALLSLQSGGMGEGWSDWLGILLTIDPGDTKDTPRVIGDWTDGPAGIRRQPYSFDMAIDSRTLDDFNGGFPNSEVHNAGEIWASALWDMTWLLIEQYGFDTDWYSGDGGNNLALQLVLDGMKLQPANPSFLEARDAIIAADVALTGGENFTDIWTAFARRGYGLSADVGASAASDVVIEAFDMPPPLSGVSGTVFEDVNANNTITASDTPLAGWTIYVDRNNNGVRDQGEPSTVSAADGTYSLPITAQGQTVIREEVQAEWQRILPASGSYTVNATVGSSFTGRNFLNRQRPGEITGLKFNDFDGDGTQDTGEPGLAGVMIYVDMNQDGHIGVLEPAGLTDANGIYRIINVPVGVHQVREVAQPGLVQTFPDPLAPATDGGAHVNVAVARGAVTPNINFGNRQSLDFGDAPASYGTLLTANGPRHGIVTGYGLTLTPGTAAGVVDGETNGQPHPGALGDDVSGQNPPPNPLPNPLPSPDDENGVLFLSGLTPGTQATVRVGVRTAGFSSGVLQGWIDFNRDGDFLDAGEQIIRDRALSSGLHDIQFVVPANALLGSTFSRFRYGIERGIGPVGAAIVGEVEDHATNILQDVAIAVNDNFPDLGRTPPDPFIKLNSTNNSLDVLRNDFGTSTDPTPEIVAADFTGPGQTLTTDAGGTVTFQGATLPLLYSPRLGFTGGDSFTYRVTATGSPISSPATVSITVSPSDPIAIDDIVRFDSSATVLVRDVFVLENDLAAQNQIIRVTGATALTSPNTTTLVPSATGDRLIFTAPAGFTGSVRYQYTIADNDATTADSSAIVTIQVTAGPTTPAASHAAIFRTQYLAANSAGNPLPGSVNSINLEDSEFFFVQLIVQDPLGSPQGLPQTEGVESAYVDFLINEVLANNPNLPLVEPVLTVDGRFTITFNSRFPLFQADNPDFSTPGVLNEIGATHDPRLETDPGDVPPEGSGNGEVLVMTVKFRALQTGTVRIQADHAESPQLPVLLFDPTGSPPVPVQIADEQVFIQTAGDLLIRNGVGEGEFTNTHDPFDVNADTNVNTLDILMIVNDMTLHGARPLNQFAIGLSGVLPEGYLDTNLDAMVNTLDILGIVNYMTARGPIIAPPAGSGEGEDGGEGEGVVMRAMAASSSPAGESHAADAGHADEGLGGMVLAHTVEESDAEQPADNADSSPEETVMLTTTGATGGALTAGPTADEDEESTLIQRLRSRRVDVDSAAADELFGRLASFRDQLRK